MRYPALHALEASLQHCRTATTHDVQVVPPHPSGALQSGLAAGVGQQQHLDLLGDPLLDPQDVL